MTESLNSFNDFLNKYNDLPGYFCLSTRGEEVWKEKYFNSTQFQEANNYIEENKWLNCYGSISTFFTKHRCKATALRPLELYADVDSHIYLPTKEEVLGYIEKLKPHFNKEIPEPSSIVYTGNGFHLHFELKSDIEIEVPKWEATEAALHNTIDNLVSDINILLSSEFKLDYIKDVSRVLRIPKTYNSESKTFAQLVYSSGKKYSLEEIMTNYDLYYYEKNGKKQERKELKELANITSEDILNATSTQLKEYKSKTKGYTIETLARARIKDFLTLISLRNAKGIREGYRNNLLNLACETLLNITNNANEIKNTLEVINNEFLVPLNEAEVRKWIQLKAVHKQYYFKTETIIERLNITEEEQEKMKTLIRRELKNSKYYQSKKEVLKKKRVDKYSETKALNEEERKNKIALAQELRSQGASIKLIATALKVSRRTVFYYLKKEI